MLIKDKDIASYQLKSKKEEIEEMEKCFRRRRNNPAQRKIVYL